MGPKKNRSNDAEAPIDSKPIEHHYQASVNEEYVTVGFATICDIMLIKLLPSGSVISIPSSPM